MREVFRTHGTLVNTTTRKQHRYKSVIHRVIATPLIPFLLLLSGNTVADSNFTKQKNASGFSSHVFTTVGFTSWSNFNDGTLTSAVEDTLQNGAPSTFTFHPSKKTSFISSIGIRATEQLSFEVNMNQLPHTDYVVGSPILEESSNFVDERSTHGWNVKIGAEYAIPLGNWGLKLTTRAGISQSKKQSTRTRKSTEPDRISMPITERVSTKWRDPFLGFGLRVPIPGKNDNWEVSFTFARIFTDEESVNQSLSAQMVYNFK